MANKKKEIKLKDFTCVNEEKFNRAVFGFVGREGKLEGGVGENASDEAKLAEYDRLGGLIKKGDYKVKTGSFYDFDKRKPKEIPEIVYIFHNLDGIEVEIPEGKKIPLDIQAGEMIRKKGKK